MTCGGSSAIRYAPHELVSRETVPQWQHFNSAFTNRTFSTFFWRSDVGSSSSTASRQMPLRGRPYGRGPSGLTERIDSMRGFDAPEWTDFNASDPGITLIELFAFVAESLLWRLDDERRRRRRRRLAFLVVATAGIGVWATARRTPTASNRR